VLSRFAIISRLRQTLDSERFEHSLRVEKIARALAKKWKVSELQVIPAALLHDCARRFDRKGLLREAKKIGLKIDPVQKTEPKLLHAELSAYLAKKEFGVSAPSILKAIGRHTTGAPAMSRLEKVIYLADHIEEGRNFKGLHSIRALAFKNLDEAVLASTTRMIAYLLEAGLPIHPASMETRNYLLLKQK
jgi:predicted HD superfamily hydrolase involved in NAD metabolism